MLKMCVISGYWEKLAAIYYREREGAGERGRGLRGEGGVYIYCTWRERAGERERESYSYK